MPLSNIGSLDPFSQNGSGLLISTVITKAIFSDSSNYKKKKQAQQKKQAGSSHNWNSLFLGHNAVAEVVADSYGVSKEDVLTPHGDGSAAVRLALGETQIVASTRHYLEEQGVILDAFNTVSIFCLSCYLLQLIVCTCFLAEL